MRNDIVDHDERIPLFLGTQKIDLELPFTPFLKYASLVFATCLEDA
jgi:hypothetical protein